MSTAQLSTGNPPALLTADEFFRDYNGRHCELIEGKVRDMSPPAYNHGKYEARVSKLLSIHVDDAGIGEVSSGDNGFLVSRDPDTVMGPDVAFVKKERLEAVQDDGAYFPEPPALAVEVVSAGDTAEDVDDKARRWIAAGCQMVWVVYPRGRSLTVYRSLENVKVLTGDATVDGEDVVAGFACTLSDFFAGLDPK